MEYRVAVPIKRRIKDIKKPKRPLVEPRPASPNHETRSVDVVKYIRELNGPRSTEDIIAGKPPLPVVSEERERLEIRVGKRAVQLPEERGDPRENKRAVERLQRKRGEFGQRIKFIENLTGLEMRSEGCKITWTKTRGFELYNGAPLEKPIMKQEIIGFIKMAVKEAHENTYLRRFILENPEFLEPLGFFKSIGTKIDLGTIGYQLAKGTRKEYAKMKRTKRRAKHSGRGKRV